MHARAQKGHKSVVAVKIKRLEYAVALDRAGRASVEGGPPHPIPEDWTAEHLVLAGLARCSLTSLRYHAHRAELDAVGSATASGLITKREEDGRYAFVELACRLDVELEPVPPGDELPALLLKAERDCFIGASLRVEPRYRWRVNGVDVSAGD
jgi:organic hydroperoxide reductase OsmC/OhrA